MLIMIAEVIIIELNLPDISKTRPGNLVDATPLIQAVGGKGLLVSQK